MARVEAKLEEIAARYGLTFHWQRRGEIMERYGVGLGQYPRQGSS